MTTKDIIEIVARALCHGDPERLEPGDCPGDRDDKTALPVPDGRNQNGEFCHFAWRNCEPAARAAIEAIRAAGFMPMSCLPTKMTTKDTRADVLDLVSTLAEEGWSIDERHEAAAMLRQLLEHAEKAEAAMAKIRVIASRHHPKTHGSYELILHEIRNLAALAGDKEDG